MSMDMGSQSVMTSPSNLERQWTAETEMRPLTHTGSGRRKLHCLLSMASSPADFPHLGLVSSRLVAATTPLILMV